MRYLLLQITFISAAFLFQGCFTMKYDLKGGAQIDPKIKTLSVQYIANRAQLVNPSLSQSLTDKLRTYMESNTNVKVVNSIGDVDFSGEITDYSLRTAAIGANEWDAQTRFTITIRIKYSNSVNPDDNFDTSFSQYRDFSSNVDFKSVESTYTEEIINELIEQIFNKAFVNW